MKKHSFDIDYLVSAANSGRTMIFDLDNTIYRETDFLFGAYKKISSILLPEYSIEAEEFLKEEFESNGRVGLFDRLKLKFPKCNVSISDCLEILRSYVSLNSIRPFNWFEEFSNAVHNDFLLRIITNGNVQQQKNKIASIDFPDSIFTVEVVYANNHKSKPNPKSYYQLKGWQSFKSPLYVGDSEVDREFCENVEIEFFQV